MPAAEYTAGCPIACRIDPLHLPHLFVTARRYPDNERQIDSIRARRFRHLLEIRDMSRRHNVRLKAFVVQPGLSKGKATESQLRLLAVTERYLSDTYAYPSQ